MKWIKRNEALLVILVVMLLLRLPSLYEPAWYGDENIYLAIGQAIRKGLVLYHGITDFPNKPPLIYLLAAGVKQVFWFRLLLLFWNGINVAVVYKLLKRLELNRLWTLGFVLLTSLPFWEGNIANAEMFFILPTTLGMLWWLDGKAFWAGVSFGVGFLFKIPVAAEIVAAGVAFGLMKEFLPIRKLINYLWGLSLPVLAMIGWLWTKGVKPGELVEIAIGSKSYVSARDDPLGLPIRVGVVMMITLGLWLIRKKMVWQSSWLSLWLAWALFGVLLSGRPYPHYLIQAVPALVALSAWGLEKNIRLKKVELVVMALIIIMGGLAYGRYKFYTYSVVNYYRNFALYITRKIDQGEFYNRFDGRMKRNYQIAKYIKTRTLVNDRIYIWGTEPEIYVLADRLPVGRLVTSFHVADLNEYEALAREINKQLPVYMVLMETETRDFPQLETLVAAKYTQVNQIDEGKIYRLIESK